MHALKKPIRRNLVSHSHFHVVSAPSSGTGTHAKCPPGLTHSGLTTRDREFVVVAITSAPRAASSGSPTGRTSAVTFCAIALANASRLAFVGLYTLTFLMFRTAHMAGRWLPACQPEPKIASVLASSRVR